MAVESIYRACIWLPLLAPILMFALGFGSASGRWIFEVIGWSFWVGGIPYAALALWARRWIRGRSESEIRMLMFVAPLLFAAMFFPLAVAYGLIVGLPGPWLGVAWWGVEVILPLGYAYVLLTLVLRLVLSPFILPPASVPARG